MCHEREEMRTKIGKLIESMDRLSAAIERMAIALPPQPVPIIEVSLINQPAVFDGPLFANVRKGAGY